NRDGARVERLVAERLDACHAGYDVEDRIQCTDLVEVHLFHRSAMHPRLGHRNATERLAGPLLRALRRVAAIDDLFDVAQVTVRMFVGQVEADAAAVDAATVGALRVHRDVAHAELRGEIAQPLTRPAKVEQGPEPPGPA